MRFYPSQQYIAILSMGGGKVQTWRRVTEFEALQRVRRMYPKDIPHFAILALRPVDRRGTILDGYIAYRRHAGRWLREEDHQDKAA